MSRLPRIALLTVLMFLLLLLAAWGVGAIYARYKGRIDRIAELESKVEGLQHMAHPKWRIREGRLSISTTDRPTGAEWHEMRLVFGTNTVQKFDESIWKEPGHIVTAWVSDWTPRSEMAKFEQFAVSSLPDGRFEVLAKGKTNESISMEFTVTFIVE